VTEQELTGILSACGRDSLTGREAQAELGRRRARKDTRRYWLMFLVGAGCLLVAALQYFKP
jgi:hypothetical protein